MSCDGVTEKLVYFVLTAVCMYFYGEFRYHYVLCMFQAVNDSSVMVAEYGIKL